MMAPNEQTAQTRTAKGSKASAFRQAIERGDLAALLQALALDVVFHSPIVFQDYHGRDALAPLLAAVMEVFRDFRYVDEFDAPNGTVLLFRATVGERELEGVDILKYDDAGLVREFTVMVRPYSAATAFREAMAAKLAERGQ